MSDELVERLQQISRDMRHDARLDGDARTLREAADEIEQLRNTIEQLHRTIEDLRAYAEQDSCRYANLRALINAWINALDELNAEWRDDDTYVTSNRYNDAETALRKAVGR